MVTGTVERTLYQFLPGPLTIRVVVPPPERLGMGLAVTNSPVAGPPPYQENQEIAPEVSMSWNLQFNFGSDPRQIAAGFPIEHLSVKGIYSVLGFDSLDEESVVYNFELGSPVENVNVILDDTPLKGLWPWPREEKGQEQETQDDAEDEN
ncbi:uncharacterized protein BKA55DRAFT_532365 [Fusarium redolens]|uniref:Uncharacterized protein n=1 Tax=Fusarium redolens TaxID=48865 RepID=A0A9P9R8Y6_FUSRE|nr:uncharacterized protein BKA55DRAFT_532365 [Fusarium redolens]KAH7269723.1 hypothetical protein BKA55DRAFT_532365 [Fusarium redolens]